MIRPLTDQIAGKIGGYLKFLNDIDGPGMGNSGIVVREDRPEEGGIYLHLYGYRYTFKGTPNADAVMALHKVKKTLLPLARSFNNTTSKVMIGLFFLLPHQLKEKVMQPFTNFAYELTEWYLHDHFLIPKRYSVCVRELYRVFTTIKENEKSESMRKLFLFIRDLFCMMIEYDSAYRFRFQDLMSEVRKEELLKGKREMAREVSRLFDLLISREVPEKPNLGNPDYNPPMPRKWLFLKRVMILAIWFVWFVPRIIKEFAEVADFTKLAFDDGDKYFVYMRKDYEFFGIPLPERIEMRKKIEDEVGRWQYFQDVANGFLQDYLKIKKQGALGATKDA